MLQFLIISVLLAIANAGDEENYSRGKWLVPMIYPEEKLMDLHCHWHDIKTLDPLRCSCGTRGDIPIYDNGEAAFPAIFINKTEDATPLFKANCFCNGQPQQHLILREINANTLVAYYKEKESGDNATLYINVLVKTVPKLSELYEVWNSVDDLRDKKSELLCDKSFFTPEDL